MKIPLPDWKDERNYLRPKRTMPEWAWEFLRRNKEYQQAYEQFCKTVETLGYDDETMRKLLFEPGISLEEKEKAEQIALQILELKNSIREKFQVEARLTQLPNPSLSFSEAMPIFTSRPMLAFYSIMKQTQTNSISNSQTNRHIVEKRSIVVSMKDKKHSSADNNEWKVFEKVFLNQLVSEMNDAIINDGYVVEKEIEFNPRSLIIEIDLDGNIPAQIEMAGMVANAQQKRLQKLENNQGRSRKDIYHYYLMVLDAYSTLKGDDTEIAEKIRSILIPSEQNNPDNNYGARRKIKQWHERGISLRDGEYKKLLKLTNN
jgi:hypothetical protein